IPRVFGRPTRTGPAARSSRSISNSSATTWNRFTGTSSRQLRRCRRRSRRRPAKNTCRPTRRSPATSYELARCGAGADSGGVGGGRFPQGLDAGSDRAGFGGIGVRVGVMVLRLGGRLSGATPQVAPGGEFRRLHPCVVRRASGGLAGGFWGGQVSEGDRAVFLRSPSGCGLRRIARSPDLGGAGFRTDGVFARRHAAGRGREFPPGSLPGGRGQLGGGHGSSRV